jgi:integrase
MDKLTELTIKQAKPGIKQYKLFDGGGMFLLVHPNGSKYWRMKFNFEDKSKLASFGVWPDVSLKEAREKRYEAKKKIKDGINPIEEKRQERQDTLDRAHKENLETQKESITFRKVAEEWHKRQTNHWSEKHTKDVLRSLEYYVYPDFGERPISEITKQDVIANLRKLESEGIHETCYRVRQRLEAIFEYAEIEEHCIGNPANNLQKIFTKPQPKNHASLPISELPVFLKKIVDDSGAFPTTKLAMMFMIHVFVRTNSLRHAMWNDFNLKSDEPLWIVPDYDMKNKIEFHVPLSSQSVKILEEMKMFSGPDGFVFPQVRYPQKAMSNNTLLYFSYRLGYAGRSTIHGFRKVASTSLHESGLWNPDVVEKQMSHLVGTKVSRAYNKAEHLNERRKMLEWWSNHIESLIVS